MTEKEKVIVSKNGNKYHKKDEDKEENVACNTFISHKTSELTKSVAESHGYEPCGYRRCYGDDE